MINKYIQKRCPKCGKLYKIPNPKGKKLKDLLIEYYPCTHCGYSKYNNDPRFKDIKKCEMCKMPFNLVEYKAHGLCHRCYVKSFREKRSQKDIESV